MTVPIGRVVDAVDASPDLVSAEAECKRALDRVGGLAAGRDLLRAEPAQRVCAGGKASVLVLARKEAVGLPGRRSSATSSLISHRRCRAWAVWKLAMA